MPKYIFTNNATSVLTMDHPAGSVVINLPTGEGALFPAPVAANDEIAMITLEDRRSGQMELCTCTQRSGDTLTVVRGQEGTAAQTFVAGALVSNRLTAGAMAAIQTGSFLVGDAGSVNYVPGVAPLTTVSVKAELDTQRTKDNSQDAAISAEITNRTNADTSLNTAVGTKVAKAGDTMTGLLLLSADPGAALGAATKQYVDTRVLKAGDTMTGPLTVVAPPASPGHAAAKSYVDAGDALALKIASNLSDLNNVVTARSNLGLVIGTNVQAFDADLQSIAALTSAANKMLYATALNTWALADLSAFARTLLDDADGPAMQTTLGISTFVKTLLDDASAAAFRTTMANPSAHAGRAGSGVVSVAAGGWVKINLSQLPVNNGGFSLSGNSLVVPETGTYSITASLSYASVANVTGHMAGYAINGNTSAAKYVRYNGLTPASNNIINGSWIESLTTGDTLDLMAQVTVTSGAVASVADTVGITALYARRVS